MKKIVSIINILVFIVSPCFSQKFTLALIPDSQQYIRYNHNTETYPKYPYSHRKVYEKQLEYIAEHSKKNGGDIVFALHEGDLSHSKPLKEIEWKVASECLEILNGQIPYVTVPGNHDFDSKFNYTPEKRFVWGLEHYKKYFGSNSIHYKNKNYYIDFYNEGTSSLCSFNVDGQDFYILALEYVPDDKCIAWAQNKINEHKGKPFILLVHNYLDNINENGVRNQGEILKTESCKRFGGNYPINVYEKFVRINPEIFLILCGHAFDPNEGSGEKLRLEINDAGRQVFAILSNYQNRKKIFTYKGEGVASGDGWFRLLEFDLEKSYIHVKTYSTETNEYEKDSNSDYFIYFDRPWNVLFPD